MLKNYIKIAFRNLFKNKTYSLINIFGLSVSMSICLLIILFIFDQRTVDQFHQHKDSVFRVVTNFTPEAANSSSWYATSPVQLANILEIEYSGVAKATTILDSFGGEAQYTDEIILQTHGFYVEPDFLEIFDFNMLKGNPATALINPGSVILKKSSAEKFFGDEDPIGKTITILGDRDYLVTGIIEDDQRSHLEFEALASMSSLPDYNNTTDWTQNFSFSYTYVLLDEGTAASAIQLFLPSILENNFQELNQAQISAFELQPITRINLGRVLSNEIGTVIPGIAILFLVGFVLIILAIAGFNYITLTIARSINRGKEVGVRKVLGANKRGVVNQFITESVITVIISLFIAVILLQLILPEFNNLSIVKLSNTQIQTNVESSFILLLIFLGFSLVIGFLAGIYPSIYLSKFKPALVLKGTTNVKGLSSGLLRKVVIVSQFSFAIIFIISSILLLRQFKFMSETDYGFDKSHVVNVALQDVPYQRFRETMIKHPSVSEIAASSKIPALGSINGMWAKSDSLENRIRVNSFEVDENYIKAMGLRLDAGRNFSVDFGADAFSSVIINKNALKALGFHNTNDALGTTIQIEGKPYQVIGVIDDFISSSPLQNNDPAILLNNPANFFYAVVKTNEGETASFLPFLKKNWYDLESQYSIQFQIFDDQLKMNPIISIFGDFTKILALIAFFTVLISCLGLLGMAMNSTQNRKKEVALRKVLGASTKKITMLLTKDYLKLIGFAILIGGLASFFLNNLWIKNLSNSIEMDSLVFILGILITLILSLLIVGSQTIIASLSNPINAIRNE